MGMVDHHPKRWYILPTIVISQFAGTSLWFAGNAVIADLQLRLGLQASALGHITSAVQFGFILGTLVFAILTISDRFSPSRVFFGCAIAGAVANLAVFLFAQGFYSLITFRVLTGFFLAGIYPVGMKIASDHHARGLGKSLGYLVGALVLGTAFPHLLRRFTAGLSWEYVFIFTSIFASIGGLLVWLFVPDGPHHQRSTKPDFSAFFKVFQKPDFRAAAFGYFGHMWELYTFWAFVPVMLAVYNQMHQAEIGASLWSFFIIAIGGVACVIGGYLSLRVGSARVAFFSLLGSGVCCLLSPLAFALPKIFFLLFLLIWGMLVITDSPQFSTLVAQRADKSVVGTALTIVNSIGFAITIASLQVTNSLALTLSPRYLYLILLIGPLFGLSAMAWQSWK